jgi:hypothetical protein
MPKLRYGAFDMLSCPPATSTRASPARTACAASITARRPEPHTMLTVSAETPGGTPALSAACRAGAWPSAGLHDVAHDDLLHVVAAHAGAPERLADGDGAEVGRLDRLRAAEELADRRAGGADDHGLAGGIGHGDGGAGASRPGRDGWPGTDRGSYPPYASRSTRAP